MPNIPNTKKIYQRAEELNKIDRERNGPFTSYRTHLDQARRESWLATPLAKKLYGRKR